MTQFTRPLVALSLTEPDASLLQYAGRLSELFAWNDLHFAHVAAADRRDDWDPRPLEQKMQAEVARHTANIFRPHAVMPRTMRREARELINFYVWL